MPTPDVITRRESNVRSYCRSFPTTFAKARGATLVDTDGREYVDFFAGAGVMSYGHNPKPLADALVAYIQEGGITHGLDMATAAKARFLEALEERVLEPRGLDYKVMFPGPTGTNAVEAALKLARKVTGRTRVVAFTNAFHGMTLGALAVTGNGAKRAGAGVPLDHTARAPFAGWLGDDADTAHYLERLLDDGSSGVEAPAAIILETVQAEGGVNPASGPWLRRVAEIARAHGALLIVDDIQVGCGRTGPFFSFEPYGVEPDIVCLSKALSGFGLPLAVTMFRRELDQWSPGEHNGTFRGNNHAFVTAAAALDRWWSDDTLTRAVDAKAGSVREALDALATRYGGEVRGRGLIQGWELPTAAHANAISREAFTRGLVIETAGPEGGVVKVLPPLTIGEDELGRGLAILTAAADRVLSDSPPVRRANGENYASPMTLNAPVTRGGAA